jgi:two-component system, cell cycle sensor histidine kinase and response regulator CckA
MATILVVDDEPTIRTLIAMILNAAGHNVVPASNGLEGISLYRSSPRRFDLILTDLVMPVMDGIQFVKLVRATNPNAKIVCMSGYTEEPLPHNVEFVPKPFQPAQLLECIEGVLHPVEK